MSWDQPQRVVVRFQTGSSYHGTNSLFPPDRFYFVTNLPESPSEVVAIYQKRGEAERVFGEFLAAMRPTICEANWAAPGWAAG